MLTIFPSSFISLFLAPKLTDSIGVVDWHKMSSIHIRNLYRALYSTKWITTHWHGKRIKIRGIDLTPTAGTGFRLLNDLKRPGGLVYDRIKKCIHVCCADGQFIRINSLQVDGRQPINAVDFNSGYMKKIDPCDRYFS